MVQEVRVAADVGGTFTDIVLLNRDGLAVTRKVPSTPDDYARGVVQGILELLQTLKIAPCDVTEVLHGCTVATNAILEHKGAKTALLTTRGFRDVLELRRIRVPRLYDPLYVKPEPLAPRNWRFEVTERMAADGSVLINLDESDVLRAVDAIRASPVEAVAICYLHSYANPTHERRTLELLRAHLPDLFITASVDILPEIREYERTSTTVINAYVGPPVRRYLTRLIDGLNEAGIRARLLVMQSSGGTLDAHSVLEQPARIIECGPAAGVIGAAYHASACGYGDVISFDMGGTTAKASLVEAGQLTHTDEYEVGGGISLSSRLVKGGGYALKLPVIDISEVGAGGGSKIGFDKGGALKVGPQSAGALPGPACYGNGGRDATVTDANVVLGNLNPLALAGGTVPIHAALARDAIANDVVKRLNVSLEEAAWWIFVVATTNMVRAVKAVSTYRGRNPADFELIAFGGNGGIFAGELLRQLQMKRALIPPAAGVFSAIGLCISDVQFSQSRTFRRALQALDMSELRSALHVLSEAALEKLAGDASGRALRRASMRYQGQGFELAVQISDNTLGAPTTAALREDFESEYARTYGHRLGFSYEVEIVSLDVTALRRTQEKGSFVRGTAAWSGTDASTRARQVYFGPEHRWCDTPVTDRHALGTEPRPGPWIIEEYEGTTVVPPDADVRLDDRGNIVIELRTAVLS